MLVVESIFYVWFYINFRKEEKDRNIGVDEYF